MWHAWKQERVIQGLVRKPQGIGLIGKPRHRLEDNIKMDFTQIV
jgi:hypothetical protein